MAIKLYYSRLWIHSIDGGDGDKVVLFEIYGYIVLREIKKQGGDTSLVV